MPQKEHDGNYYHGEMPEWLNGTVSKTVEEVTPPRVQIPLSPPVFKHLRVKKSVT